MWKMLNITPDMLNKNPSKEIIELTKTGFHRQIIEAWLRINKCRNYTEETILNEYILCNKNIKMKGKMFSKNFFKNDNSINLKIWDIIDNNGSLKTRENLNTELSLNMKQLDYNSLKSAIPIKWKKQLKKENMKKKYTKQIWLDQVKTIHPIIYKENGAKTNIKSLK